MVKLYGYVIRDILLQRVTLAARMALRTSWITLFKLKRLIKKEEEKALLYWMIRPNPLKYLKPN